MQTERWLARPKARLLACEHYHVIFIMPHELNALWVANVAVMTQLLFASVHETLVELLGDAKCLGGKPGLIAMLHTWSQTLVWHPHVHCLVTGGELHAAGQKWRPAVPPMVPRLPSPWAWRWRPSPSRPTRPPRL